jgi:predicted ATPase
VAYDLQSVQRTAFVGRARELHALSTLLEQGARLVTLLGAPGVGKTRLALELAARKLRAEPGSVWVADLSRASDQGDINRALAEALGWPSSELSSERLSDELARRGRQLVVLDGFENLVEHAASTLGVWLTRAPELGVLVASRRRLGRSGEVLFELEPLDDAAALALFVDRARAAQPGFDPVAAELQLLPELMRALDGLPLAIELAASRLRVLPIAALIERAADLPSLLVDEGRRGRGASLDAALERSWSTLESWQRSALASCCTFDAPFSLAAAESLLARGSYGARSVLDVLQSLRDCSLLMLAASGEYRVANGLRQYVRKQLRERDPIREPPTDALALVPGARRFRVPGGDWVMLPRESPMRLILLRLVEAHAERRGQAVALDQLVSAGWPGERMLADAARNRGYMALSRLRKLGLGPLIERNEDGYRLAPDLRIVQLPD